VSRKNALLELALELEKAALADDYFIKRKLFPNVDFYSGIGNGCSACLCGAVGLIRYGVVWSAFAQFSRLSASQCP